MKTPYFAPNTLQLLIAVALGTVACASVAAPTISRLTPPSNPAVVGATTLARFLPGQRFDLQATVRPEAGLTITSVSFAVDGVIVAAPAANSSIVPATAITATAPGAVAASLRAYSNSTIGMHTLTATATQSDGTSTTATGSFEVMPILTNQGRVAKNVIVLLGDGMGAAHRTAARIMVKGYAQGMAQGKLAMDTFPFTGMVMTSSLNSIVTDSAPGMANYVTGNKAQNNQEGVFPDDTTDAFDNPRVEYLSEYLHRTKGKSLGIVTTADVFDATPAANAVHTSNRGNGTGIVDQYLDDRNLTGLTVLMGGGRKWFLAKNSAAAPANSINTGNGSVRSTSTDYVLPSDLVAGWGAAPGAIDINRDLITDFQTAGFAYAADKTSMDAAGVPDKLLGLFSYSNMNVAFDKIGKRRGTSTIVDDYGFPDQPMLDEMADKAIKVLNKNNTNGFYLMIEGASIDKQSHLMDADRFIEETIEFDRAVKVAQDFATANPDTLVIVTADHECAGVGIIGAYTGSGFPSKANVATYDAAAFPKYTILPDGYPQTTDVPGKMLIGYAGNADRFETWKASAQPAQDSQQSFIGQAPLSTYPVTTFAANGSALANTRNASTGYLVTGQVPGDQGVHTATDIPLSAFGRGSILFSGVMDNTDVFFKIGQAVFGGSK
ncbi:alkaline phosphatase [Actimicrobium sp. GrIS 1.19]|uniref:alkaline phosphatase n=1 Tax=Actimicrobium sp. GrIS 1.19 TaxID=3071708 RepID=UPI002E02D4F7|nr:alkaline phosphatase [Actimicrobium sp. GrIS 1.19]